MRRLLMWSSVAGFTACLLKPTLATVIPSYGYVDGCQPVIIQGHHLGTAAKGRIGDSPLLDFRAADIDEKLEEHAQDVGFKYFGTSGPAPGGKAGWYDVILEVDGEELVLDDGWYYRACPATFAVDAYTVPTEADVGSVIIFEGCGLGGNVTLQFLDDTLAAVGSADLVSDCSTADVHANVPALPAGDYTMQLVATDGTVFLLETCSSESGDTGETCVPDTITLTAR
jgi:hypothetical protein